MRKSVETDAVSDVPEVLATISDVQIWRFTLDLDAWTVRQMRTHLSVDERIRADRYFTDQLRDRFVVARATMRSLLADSLGIEPGRLEFAYGANGKPALANAQDLQFNLSHSGGCALLAISNIHTVGVDIEGIDERTEIETIASHFFTAVECREMIALEAGMRRARFFDLWCCKEAYLKAVGTGISAGLNTCSIVDNEDGTASILNPARYESNNRWQIHRLASYPGYAAAVCLDLEK